MSILIKKNTFMNRKCYYLNTHVRRRDWVVISLFSPCISDSFERRFGNALPATTWAIPFVIQHGNYTEQRAPGRGALIFTELASRGRDALKPVRCLWKLRGVLTTRETRAEIKQVNNLISLARGEKSRGFNRFTDCGRWIVYCGLFLCFCEIAYFSVRKNADVRKYEPSLFAHDSYVLIKR